MIGGVIVAVGVGAISMFMQANQPELIENVKVVDLDWTSSITLEQYVTRTGLTSEDTDPSGWSGVSNVRSQREYAGTENVEVGSKEVWVDGEDKTVCRGTKQGATADISCETVNTGYWDREPIYEKRDKYKTIFTYDRSDWEFLQTLSSRGEEYEIPTFPNWSQGFRTNLVRVKSGSQDVDYQVKVQYFDPKTGKQVIRVFNLDAHPDDFRRMREQQSYSFEVRLGGSADMLTPEEVEAWKQQHR